MPPGNFSPGSTYISGPMYTDPFGAKRAPSPWQLIEKYKALIYAMVAKNANAVCRLPLRLYADGSRAQGGKPRSACDPIRALRSVGQRLCRAGLVSPSAVDKIYEVRAHPFLTLLDHPDPYRYFTRTKLISLMVRYCDVVGTAYFMPDWDGWNRQGNAPKRVPDYLWVLYSQYVLPIRMPASPLIDKFQYFNERIPYDFLIWFRQNHSLRDPYGSGYSPVYAGDQYAEQEQKQIAILDQVLGLGPRPNMFATAKDPLQPPGVNEAKRFEQDLVRKHAGGYAGGVLVNTGAWDFTPASYAPADMGGKEISEYDRDVLATIFGQPPTYYTHDTNLANLQAADQQHARDGIEPRCKMIAETLTDWIRLYDPRLFFSFDDALPEDEELKTRILDMQLKNGSITIDQANEESQWPPVPWGKEPWMSNTLIQPSMAQKNHEVGLVAAQAGVDALNSKADGSNSDNDEETGKQPAEKFSKDDKSNEKRSIDMMIDRALDRLEAELAGVS